jgi:putative membrane protein
MTGQYASLALLHPGGEFSWTAFPVHLSTLLGCLLWVAGYYHIIVRWRPPGEAPATTAQQVGFVGGTVILFLSLNGPLHDLSDYFLFSAHMVQHLLITMIVPPLWLLGLPAWALRAVVWYRPVRATARFLTGPLIAFAIYNVVFVSWHFPQMYNWALVNHNAHILQHLMFIGAAVLMWWPVVSPVPELDRIHTPLRMVYLFALGIPMSIVSALITLSERPLYQWYVDAPRVWENVSALDDQQIGGLIMWVPGMMVFWVAITIIFFRWSTREQREEWRERELIRTGS